LEDLVRRASRQFYAPSADKERLPSFFKRETTPLLAWSHHGTQGVDADFEEGAGVHKETAS